MRRPARGGPSGIGLLAAFLLCGCLWLRLGLGGCFLFRGRLLRGLLRSGFGLLRRSLFLDLGLQLEVDELEDRYLGGVAAAGAELDDAGVAARTIGETGAEGVEQLGRHRLVDDADCLAAVVDAVCARQRDE